MHAFAGAGRATRPSWKAVGKDRGPQRRAGAFAHEARQNGKSARSRKRGDDVKGRAVQSYYYGFHLIARRMSRDLHPSVVAIDLHLPVSL